MLHPLIQKMYWECSSAQAAREEIRIFKKMYKMLKIVRSKIKRCFCIDSLMFLFESLAQVKGLTTLNPPVWFWISGPTPISNEMGLSLVNKTDLCLHTTCASKARGCPPLEKSRWERCCTRGDSRRVQQVMLLSHIKNCTYWGRCSCGGWVELT